MTINLCPQLGKKSVFVHTGREQQGWRGAPSDQCLGEYAIQCSSNPRRSCSHAQGSFDILTHFWSVAFRSDGRRQNVLKIRERHGQLPHLVQDTHLDVLHVPAFWQPGQPCAADITPPCHIFVSNPTGLPVAKLPASTRQIAIKAHCRHA